MSVVILLSVVLLVLDSPSRKGYSQWQIDVLDISDLVHRNKTHERTATQGGRERWAASGRAGGRGREQGGACACERASVRGTDGRAGGRAEEGY